MRKLLLTVVTSTVLLLFPLFSQAQASNAEVTGTVAYRERMALPPDAVINVQLLDASIADIAAQTVSDVMINAEGRQVPVSFTLTYDPAKIVPGNRYSVRATIRSGDGMLMFSSTQAYPVLTHGAPSKVNLILYRVGHGAKPVAAAKKPAAPAAAESTASDAQPATSESGAPATTAPSTATAPSAPPPNPPEPDKPATQAETAPAQSAAEPPTPPPAEPTPVAQPEAAAPSESSSRTAQPGSALTATQNEPSAPAPAEAQTTPPESKTEPAAPAPEAKPSEPEAPLPEAPSTSKGMAAPPAPGDSTEPGADAEANSPPARAVPATALAPLANTQWKLLQLNGLDVVIPSTQRPITLAFSPEGRRIAGSAGCNSFLGTYTEEHGVLHMSPGNMTMMSCPDPVGSREKKFVAMLRLVDGYRLNGDFLLLTSKGKTVAKFKTNPPL